MWLLVKYVATFSNLIFVAVKMNISKMDKGLFFLQINGFFLKNRITVKEQKEPKNSGFLSFFFFSIIHASVFTFLILLKGWVEGSQGQMCDTLIV